MKRPALLFLCIIISNFLLGANINHSEQPPIIYQTNLSMGFVNGGALGIGRIKETSAHTVEQIINLHYDYHKDFYSTGIYFQFNNFSNPKRTGFFWLLNAGLDYTEGEEKFRFIVGESNDNNSGDKYKRCFPYASVGIGYGFKFIGKSNARFYWDIGLKRSISNINLSIQF